MPQKVTCGDCGEELYNGNDLKTPEEIIQKLGGLCPKCGKELSFNPDNIDVQVPSGK